jgi:hypothetical protein
MRGTYELPSSHKSYAMRHLPGSDYRLSKPDLFIGELDRE